MYACLHPFKVSSKVPGREITSGNPHVIDQVGERRVNEREASVVNARTSSGGRQALIALPLTREARRIVFHDAKDEEESLQVADEGPESVAKSLAGAHSSGVP